MDKYRELVGEFFFLNVEREGDCDTDCRCCAGKSPHLGQKVCDKDGDVDWCIVLVEMPLSRFEECWPLPTESLLELP